MEKQWTYTQVCTQKISFELEKPSWGRKLHNFIKMDLQSTEYIKTCLALFVGGNSRYWHVHIYLQSQYVVFPCFKESLTLRRLCFSCCWNRGIHLLLAGCVTLCRSSLNSVLWSLVDLYRSPSISVDLPWFDLISAFYSRAGSYSVA